jgi:predicted ATP-binding protein involved in virulence
MEHISEFRINKFRGLRDLKIEGLGQVNLFVGNNNSGKTSVLEALSLFCDPLNWGRWYDTDSEREVIADLSLVVDRITWLFAQGGDSKEKGSLSISASGNISIKDVSASYEKFNEIRSTSQITKTSIDSSKIKSVVDPSLTEFLLSAIENLRLLENRIDIPSKSLGTHFNSVRVNITVSGNYTESASSENEFLTSETLTFTDRHTMQESKQEIVPTIPVIMINPFTHRTRDLTSSLWSEVVEADLKDDVIKLVQHFDPAILDIDFIAPTARRQLISVKHANLGRAPLHTFGDGLRRVFTLATAIPRVRNGFLLIDELETSIHTEALEKTFEWLVKACIDNNVQLLATTHSLEALDVMAEVSLDIDNFVVYRLQQEKEQTIAKRFDKAKVLRLREELGMDLR